MSIYTLAPAANDAELALELGSKTCYAPAAGAESLLDPRGSDNPGGDVLHVFPDDAEIDSDHEVIGKGHPSEIDLDLRARLMLKRRLELTFDLGLEINTLGRFLADMFTANADPSGQSNCAPLELSRDGRAKVIIANTEVYNVGFAQVPARLAAPIRNRARAKFAASLADHQSGRVPDKRHEWLRWQIQQKFGGDLVADLDPTGKITKPGTLLSDDFSTNTIADWDFNSGAGWSISGGYIQRTTTPATAIDGVIRYSTDFGVDDYYSEANSVSGTERYHGTAVRISADYATYYFHVVRSSGSFRRLLGKYLSSTPTNFVQSASPSATPPDLLYLHMDGSSYQVYLNGGSGYSTTDTSITGNLRGGLTLGFGSTAVGGFTDWEGYDWIPSTSTYDEAVDLGVDVEFVSAANLETSGALALATEAAQGVAGGLSIDDAIALSASADFAAAANNLVSVTLELAASGALAQSATLDAAGALSLSAVAAILQNASLITAGAITLAAAADTDAASELTTAGEIALAVQAEIALTVQSVMDSAVSLGVTADQAQTAGLVFEQAISFAVSAILTQSATKTLQAKILELVAQQLTQPNLSGETWTVPEFINQALASPALTDAAWEIPPQFTGASFTVPQLTNETWLAG